MSTFGKEAEEKLLSWLKEAQGYIAEDRLSPTDAIAKVALDNQVPFDQVPLLVQAYNTGRQAFQREKCGATGGVLCKMADYPIAVVEDVIKQAYPTHKPVSSALAAEKEAVSGEYSRPPEPNPVLVKAAREKLASVKLPRQEVDRGPGDPMIKMSKAYGQRHRLLKLAEEARYQAVAARDRFLQAVGQVGDYFKQARHEPFEEACYNVEHLFEDPGKAVMEHIIVRNRLKQAYAPRAPKTVQAVSPDRVPYSLVKNAILKGKEMLDAQRKRFRLEDELPGKVAEIIRPFGLGGPPPRSSPLGPCQPPSSSPKEASVFGGIMGGLSVGMGRSMMGGMPQSGEQLVEGTEMELSDPAHVDELRGIEAKAVFNDLLANDEIISGYDPTEVSEAYNEIVQLSPSTAIQPALLRPMLRKRLTAGSVEPFEAQQLADVEKTMRQTDTFGSAGTKGVLSSGSPVLA